MEKRWQKSEQVIFSAKNQGQRSNGSAVRVSANTQTHKRMDGWTLPIALSPCFAKATRSIMKQNSNTIHFCQKELSHSSRKENICRSGDVNFLSFWPLYVHDWWKSGWGQLMLIKGTTINDLGSGPEEIEKKKTSEALLQEKVKLILDSCGNLGVGSMSTSSCFFLLISINPNCLLIALVLEMIKNHRSMRLCEKVWLQSMHVYTCAGKLLPDVCSRK